MSLNKVMLIGNVGRDPNVRYLDGNAGGQGSKVATFTLATTERFRDRSGETRENTEWHNIVAWRNSADLAEKFIHKGTQIYVEGRLRTRSYTDQAGVQKYTTEVVADNIQLLGRRQDGDENGQPRQQYGGGQSYGSSQQYGAPAQPAYQQPQYGQPAPPVPSTAPVQPATPVQPAATGFESDPSDDLPF
jgi:single-strand DNA-binding protein